LFSSFHFSSPLVIKRGEKKVPGEGEVGSSLLARSFPGGIGWGGGGRGPYPAGREGKGGF